MNEADQAKKESQKVRIEKVFKKCETKKAASAELIKLG